MSMYLYVLDTLADWEIAHLTAEVHSKRFFRAGARCEVVTVGVDGKAVTTMGGMRIVPDQSLEEMDLRDEDLLVLPGGDLWMDARQDAVLELARQRIERDLPVAAICGATFGLARVGALESKHHTSNDLGYLRWLCPGYGGAELYRNARAVVDRGLVTASGQSALDFACESLRLLDVFAPATLEAWTALYQTNDPQHYHALVASLG